jgi:hypothetical protein
MAAVSKSNIFASFDYIAPAFGLFLALISMASAQEKVSFPSTDGDLKSGTPTIINGYLYKPSGPGPLRRLSAFTDATAQQTIRAKSARSTAHGAKSSLRRGTSFS